MTATGHAVIGAVIAAKIINPALAIPLALTSHVVADIIPHWDAGTNGRRKTPMQLFFEASIDVFVGFLIAYLLLTIFFPTTNLLYAILIILSSQLFDWLAAPSSIFHIKLPPFSWMNSFQSKTNTRLDKPWGIILQVVLLSSLVTIAKLF